MRSSSARFLEGIQYSGADAAILRALGEAKGQQAVFSRQSPEVLESLKTLATIGSTESSNRIEGITAPKNRIEGIVMKSTDSRLEVQRHPITDWANSTLATFRRPVFPARLFFQVEESRYTWET